MFMLRSRSKKTNAIVVVTRNTPKAEARISEFVANLVPTFKNMIQNSGKNFLHLDLAGLARMS